MGLRCPSNIDAMQFEFWDKFWKDFLLCHDIVIIKFSPLILKCLNIDINLQYVNINTNLKYLNVHVFLSVHPFVQTKLCRRCNSATTGPIHCKSSSLELTWPVDVQCHVHLPVRSLESCSQDGGPSSDLLVLELLHLSNCPRTSEITIKDTGTKYQ